MSPVKRRTEQVPTYRALIKVTAQVVDNARGLLKVAKAAPVAHAPARREIERLGEQLQHYAVLADRVVSQARRRVLEGEQVSAQEKLYSIFEPHTDLIKRGKTNTPVEFGHKVLLVESRRGLITDYQILDGNPPDELQVAPSLQRHRQQFGKVPKLYAGDRGFYSAPNVTLLSTAGVAESIPQRGGRKTPQRAAYEKSRRFKRAQKFRAGIEGRISVLGRGRGMKRCLLRGRDGFEVLVGAAAVLANNLLIIATYLKRKSQRRLAA